MANNNEKLVPQSESKLDNMKYEIANEAGVTLQKGYNGNISARDAGRIGGNMVKKMIEYAENKMK